MYRILLIIVQLSRLIVVILQSLKKKKYKILNNYLHTNFYKYFLFF